MASDQAEQADFGEHFVGQPTSWLSHLLIILHLRQPPRYKSKIESSLLPFGRTMTMMVTLVVASAICIPMMHWHWY